MARNQISRARRNRNPGNIRRSQVRFKGEVQPSSDPDFKEFESMAWGYRAMFVVMNTYSRKYGICTIRGIVTRWAPPSENDTESYVRYVSRRSGIDPDVKVYVCDGGTMKSIAEAMSRIERGSEPTAEEMEALEEGWRLFAGDRIRG